MKSKLGLIVIFSQTEDSGVQDRSKILSYHIQKCNSSVVVGNVFTARFVNTYRTNYSNTPKGWELTSLPNFMEKVGNCGYELAVEYFVNSSGYVVNTWRFG